jgi:hypothetical protein
VGVGIHFCGKRITATPCRSAARRTSPNEPRNAPPCWSRCLLTRASHHCHGDLKVRNPKKRFRIGRDLSCRDALLYRLPSSWCHNDELVHVSTDVYPLVQSLGVMGYAWVSSSSMRHAHCG